jgi:hypothetical protein
MNLPFQVHLPTRSQTLEENVQGQRSYFPGNQRLRHSGPEPHSALLDQNYKAMMQVKKLLY